MSPRLPTILWLLLAAAACGQTFTRPKTVMNMKWGASRIEVLKTIADAGGTVAEALYDSTEPHLQCAGGKFAGQDVAAWDAEFVHGQLVGFAVTMKSAESGSALYREIKKELTKKYGQPTGERKLSTLTPDQKRALQVAGARIPNQGTSTTWKFAPNLQEKDSLTLACEMAPPAGVATEDENQFLVTIRYASESLKAQLNASGGVTSEPGTAKTGRPLIRKDL